MTFHVSFGLVILLLVVPGSRGGWLTLLPGSSLPPWQRLSSEAVHWLLYALVMATTVTGWVFASFRGWSMSLFYLCRCRCWLRKMRRRQGDRRLASGDGVDVAAVIGIHVAAALVHIFIYRDRIMQRMLPG